MKKPSFLHHLARLPSLIRIAAFEIATAIQHRTIRSRTFDRHLISDSSALFSQGYLPVLGAYVDDGNSIPFPSYNHPRAKAPSRSHPRKASRVETLRRCRVSILKITISRRSRSSFTSSSFSVSIPPSCLIFSLSASSSASDARSGFSSSLLCFSAR